MNLPVKIRLVVFDCDGTLVDSQHSIVAAMRRAFAMNDLPEPEAHAVRRTVGLSLNYAVGALWPAADFSLRAGLVEDYRRASQELRILGAPESPLYDGAAEVIAGLDAAGYLLGVATGKSQRGLRAMLEAFDLAKHFVTLQTADDAPSKPHPGMVDNAMSETGMTPCETVVVGDTSFDMEMAINAGARAIGVSWGYHEAEELHRSGALTVIDSFSGLPGVIDALES